MLLIYHLDISLLEGSLFVQQKSPRLDEKGK